MKNKKETIPLSTHFVYGLPRHLANWTIYIDMVRAEGCFNCPECKATREFYFNSSSCIFSLATSNNGVTITPNVECDKCFSVWEITNSKISKREARDQWVENNGVLELK